MASAAMVAAGAPLAPRLFPQEKVQSEKPTPPPPAEIKTNIDEVRKIPRVANSLPGKYPGKVIRFKTGANPRFIYDANVLLFGTDPVAVDAVAHDIIVKERMARGTQQVDAKGRSAFLEIAEGLGLGVAAREDRDKEREFGLRTRQAV